MESGPPEKKIFNALGVYRERGAYLRRLELYGESRDAYDEAIKYGPEDVPTLIGRSLTSGIYPSGALCCIADATQALQLEPQNLYVRCVQANALFTMSEFERSVVMSYRGSRVRKQPSYFTEGVNRGESVIQECIGKGAGQVLLDFLPIIKTQEAEISGVDSYAPQKSKRVSRIPSTVQKAKCTQLETRKHQLLSRVLAMKYFGPLASDKFFLQNIVNNPALHTANAKGSKELKLIIEEALLSICQHQEVLRSQRPYYTVKLAEKSESKHQTEFKKKQLISERISNTRTAKVLLNQITEFLKKQHVRKLLSTAEQLQNFLDTKTPHSLPDIEVLTERLYRLVGRGYLCQYRLSYKLSQRNNRRRVAFLMGLPDGRPTSYDSVLENYPYQYVEPKQAYEKMLQRLDICENDFMRCWILYELGRLSTIMKNYALGKFYAKRCQRQAQDVSSVSWWLNGCIVLISGDMQQNNLNDIRIAVEEAYKYAMKSDDVKIQAFLKKCYEMASEIVPADENKEIRDREKQILNILDEKTHTEAALLLKRIRMLPPGRRFSVLPRKRVPEAMMISERRRAYQKGISVVQGPTKPVHIMKRSKILGYQNFDI